MLNSFQQLFFDASLRTISSRQSFWGSLPIWIALTSHLLFRDGGGGGGRIGQGKYAKEDLENGNAILIILYSCVLQSSILYFLMCFLDIFLNYSVDPFTRIIFLFLYTGCYRKDVTTWKLSVFCHPQVGNCELPFKSISPLCREVFAVSREKIHIFYVTPCRKWRTTKIE